MAVLREILKEINVKNKENKNLKLLGIKKEKYFFDSIANTIGTDFKSYKIVKKGQFACNLQHVDRDKSVPIALLNDSDEIIVSPSYNVFECYNENFDKDYLYLCFKRNKFDDHAWFLSGASIRGNLTLDNFLNIHIPELPIKEQKNLVKNISIIENRLKILNQINNNLS